MNSDAREQFGKRLEAALGVNITHREVAELTGSTGATIGKWIHGEAPYCVLVLAELHRKLNIDLNKLICGKEQGQDGDERNNT